jgi:hypothetical protein
MVTCLIWLLIYAIIATIVLYVIEAVLVTWPGLPPLVTVLLRALVALVLVLWIVQCLGFLAHPPPWPR